MILGRRRSLWLSLVATVLNVSVVVFNVHLDVNQLASLNALAIAVIGVIANEDDPTSAGTFAFTTKAPSGSSTVKGS
jgi:uncharacterized membrane protein